MRELPFWVRSGREKFDAFLSRQGGHSPCLRALAARPIAGKKTVSEVTWAERRRL